MVMFVKHVVGIVFICKSRGRVCFCKICDQGFFVRTTHGRGRLSVRHVVGVVFVRKTRGQVSFVRKTRSEGSFVRKTRGQGSFVRKTRSEGSFVRKTRGEGSFVRKTREAPNRVSNSVQPWARLRRSACRGSRSGADLNSTPFDTCLTQTRATTPSGVRSAVASSSPDPDVRSCQRTPRHFCRSVGKVVIPVSCPFPSHPSLPL